MPGFDLHAALADVRRNSAAHGGHATAAGLKIEEDKLAAFRAAFCELAAAEIGAAAAAAELRIDAEAPLSAFTLQAVDQIERLAPFGQHNARPLLCASGATLAGPPKPIGGGGRHLVHEAFAARRGLSGGGLRRRRMGRRVGRRRASDRRGVPAGHQHVQGRQNVELHLVDWRMSRCDCPS